MPKIEKIDKNMAIESTIDKTGLAFYNVLEAPFRVYGIFKEDGRFRRLPEAVAKQVSTGVTALHANTAGGRLRFKTDSSYVAISSKLDNVPKFDHVALTGTSAFDLYVKHEEGFRYIKTFRPQWDMNSGYDSLIQLGEKKEREILIHFPTYCDTIDLYIGIEEDATVSAPTEYKYTKPFVAYGSSITQGGCASRTGNAYEAILSRRFDIDHINLGFSGNARAEDVMADYVANLDMSLFLYDYDHNAPTLEHYKDTHEKMFKKVREKHPDMPILIMTRPNYHLVQEWLDRREVAYQTYQNALAAGDKRVWFIDGPALMALCGDEGTVDNTHPTDLGFFSMAKVIGDWMEENHILDLIETV